MGRGGLGKVSRARPVARARLVCLKMLKPTLLEDSSVVGRFEREALAASRLNHPNSIQVLDFGRNDTDGSLYIVMEYVQGKDLRLVLRDEWPVPEERLCNIMAQVLAALGEAHAHNVIHRDLKPENVMVEQRRDHPDCVKVLDFGIAKMLDSELPALTRSDAVCGPRNTWRRSKPPERRSMGAATCTPSGSCPTRWGRDSCPSTARTRW